MTTWDQRREHRDFATWDAAYVLGALTRADRYAFEAHLETCALCRSAVGELAPMPGLLARIAPDAAPEREPVSGPVSEPVSGPVFAPARVPRRTRRRSRRLALAAVLVVLALAVPAVLLAVSGGSSDDSVAVRLHPAADVSTSMTVDVGFESSPWGTRLTIRCEYPDIADYRGHAARYALIVTDGAGVDSQVSTWRAVAGGTVTLDAATAVDLDDIETVSVVAESGEVALTSSVPGSRSG